MTLILGIRCRDGIVIAADSMGTENQPGTSAPLGRHEAEKIIQHRELLWGCSGDVGTKQIVQDGIAKHYTDIYSPDRSASNFRVQFTEKVFPLIRKQYEAVVLTAKASTIQAPVPQVNMLFGAYMQKKFNLISIEQDGNGYVVEHGHCCTGSGMKTGQALLRRLRTHDWDIKTAEIVAYRTLDDAIHVEPGGIGPPIKLARYTLGTDGKPKIEILTDDDIAVIKTTAEFWKATEQDALSKLMNPSQPTPQPEPIPPAPAAPKTA